MLSTIRQTAAHEGTTAQQLNKTLHVNPVVPDHICLMLFIAVWPHCCLALQDHRKLRMLGHMTEQVQPETAAGALSSSACSAWRPATACLSRRSVCLLPAAATASCWSQLWQREAHADAHSVALHSPPPVCVSMQQVRLFKTLQKQLMLYS